MTRIAIRKKIHKVYFTEVGYQLIFVRVLISDYKIRFTIASG